MDRAGVFQCVVGGGVWWELGNGGVVWWVQGRGVVGVNEQYGGCHGFAHINVNEDDIACTNLTHRQNQHGNANMIRTNTTI